MDKDTKINAGDDLLGMTSRIVSAYVARNSVPPSELPALIASVHAALCKAHDTAPATQVTGVRKPNGQQKSDISVRESISPDYLICLEDGRRLKMLKRHLRTAYNMTPEEYRRKWNLPHDYPMVAPSYSRKRSDFAKRSGFGRNRPMAGNASQPESRSS